MQHIVTMPRSFAKAVHLNSLSIENCMQIVNTYFSHIAYSLHSTRSASFQTIKNYLNTDIVYTLSTALLKTFFHHFKEFRISFAYE